VLSIGTKMDDLCARFKVIDSLIAAKMAKYEILVMTPMPSCMSLCRVAGCIISIRPTYSAQCTYLLAYLLTQLARGV